ncbi:2-dehydropantoate 2-reductase [Polychaeton citri CBS 116435]|uniref:2-dehydropantoate 2-reductase n=1 Tax=Polychaeton citri CBS 116435 TaxID=1314669 RepID=A0A9P4QFF6_9PEZI|nr:2-dehydropantoate 2-reductase [Polychaeton citri CBS 116435]
MVEDKTTVLLYGLGAIGGFYAFVLNRNEDVALSVVARSNYETVKQNGLLLKSENHGEHVVKPANIFKSCLEAKQTFDYVVCVNKATEQATAVENLRPVISENTTIAIMQNGVGNEEPFRAAFPRATIISGVVWVGAAQPELGVVTHTKAENTELGLYPNPDLDAAMERSRLDKFCSFFRNGGSSYIVYEDIQVQRWTKVIWNIAWNPITALTMLDTHEWMQKSSPEAVPMTKQLMRDAIDVAQRCGVNVDYGLVDVLLGRATKLAGFSSSMATDAREGRPLELDVIVGYPIRKANSFGMAVPTLRAVYALTEGLNYKLKQKL